MKFEVCANGVTSCVAAQEGGADRVELCAGIPEGGTTPSLGTIIAARKAIDIQLNVIIRPRGGDFLYSRLEIEEMETDIKAAIDAGADGLVFGCLNVFGDIDLRQMQRLMQAAAGHPVTFHRAFDHCRDPHLALRQIEELGCARILTSGQKPTAPEGAELLKQLHEEATSVILLAGCGVNESNIAQLAADTGIEEFHFSAREAFPSSMLYRNPDVYMGAKDANENERIITTAQRVKDTIAAAKSVLF